MTNEQICSNVLTQDLVSTISESLFNRAKISRPKFTEEEVGNVLATIWEINSLDDEAKFFNGASLNEWSIPEFFKNAVFGKVTFSGSPGERRLVEWSDETDYETLEFEEMYNFTERFYATFKARPSHLELSTARTKLVPIASLVGNLMVTNDRVSGDFINGSFPVYSTFGLIESWNEGITHTNAIQRWISAELDKL